jgi:thioredoxin reductase (NADPH)
MDFSLEKANKTKLYDVVIIGGGPAGSSAALYTARAGLSTLVIDKGLTAGALGITGKIANYPGILEPISGADLLSIMRKQAISFGVEYASDRVQGVELAAAPKIIYTNNQTYNAKAVILATGSMGRGQRVTGEDALLGHGVSYCATCDAAFFRGQQVVVAGSSDEAVEEALYLTRFVEKVYFLSPTPAIKAPAELVKELTENQKVEISLGAVVKEVLGKERVEGVKYSLRGEGEEVLPVTGAFIYLQGGRPITDFIQGQLPLSPDGYVSVNNEFQTEIPGVFAVGDILKDHIKQAVIAAAEGATAAIMVEKFLSGKKKALVDWAK